MLGNLLASLFVLIGSLFMYYKASQLREMNTQGYESVGPDFWPKLILIFMIALSGYLSAKYAVKLSKEKKSGIEPSGENEEEKGGWIRIGVTTLLIVAYIYLLKPLGFIVASPIFIVAMMLYINPQKKRSIPAGVVGIMVIIYLLFGKLLYIPLPKGTGIFREVSILLGL